MGSNQDPQSLHKYAYCHGDPVNGIDPTGEFTLIEVLVVAAVLVLMVGYTVIGIASYKRMQFTSKGEVSIDDALKKITGTPKDNLKYIIKKIKLKGSLPSLLYSKYGSKYEPEGWYNSQDNIIYLAQYKGNKKVDEIDLYRTILHELVHALDYHYGRLGGAGSPEARELNFLSEIRARRVTGFAINDKRNLAWSAMESARQYIPDENERNKLIEKAATDKRILLTFFEAA